MCEPVFREDAEGLAVWHPCHDGRKLRTIQNGMQLPRELQYLSVFGFLGRDFRHLALDMDDRKRPGDKTLSVIFLGCFVTTEKWAQTSAMIAPVGRYLRFSLQRVGRK